MEHFNSPSSRVQAGSAGAAAATAALFGGEGITPTTYYMLQSFVPISRWMSSSSSSSRIGDEDHRGPFNGGSFSTSPKSSSGGRVRSHPSSVYRGFGSTYSYVPSMTEVNNDHDYDPAERTLPEVIMWSRTLLQNVGRSRISLLVFALFVLLAFYYGTVVFLSQEQRENEEDIESFRRPSFVNERPYITSTYYSTTTSKEVLYAGTEHNPQVHAKKLIGKKNEGERRLQEQEAQKKQTRLAVLRPFCAFDAEALPTTFAAWDTLAPCKAAVTDLGDFDEPQPIPSSNSSSSHLPPSTKESERPAADVFLFYSQTFANSPEAVKAVDSIIATFNEPGGWSECFDNIYAIEANIPPELDLYIPSAQEELYNWVNGPNRQFEAAFRVIQSGEWGDFAGFYLMEGDSIPIKAHWLDEILGAVEENAPFAILGAKYNGDKWDQFYEQIPISLLNHINGNGIYNTSHPLLERLVGQLEVEAPCPYNSIPYDYRMSQMVVEGALGIVPTLAPKIMLNEDGQNITLSDNTEMFAKWWNTWAHEQPFKETPVIHNYAATNLIPRHMGPEYVIHGAKLYAPWDPSSTEVTLVVSEWFADRSTHLLSTIDKKEHPFSEIVLMLPPDIEARDEEGYENMTVVPVTPQHRTVPDYMDLCEAEIRTEWFMITNSYHHVATHVDLMFTPATIKPVVPFTPATYPFCFKFPYCKENVNLAQRFNPSHDKVVQDMDMLFNTAERDKFCNLWKERYGEEGEDLYKKDRRALRRKKFIGPKGPTATDYTAFLISEGKDGMYKFTDRSLYGARDNFIKVFKTEEKLDSLTPDELAKLSGVNGFDNVTNCECATFESQAECEGGNLNCIWRPLFDTCHPPEMIDDGTPICPQTDPPTMAPTVAFEMDDTTAPTPAPTDAFPAGERALWYANLFKTTEHDKSDSSSLSPTPDSA